MHYTPLDRRRLELNLYDPDNPRALVHLLPEAFARRIRALWDSDQKELLGMNEKRLLKTMKAVGHYPDPLDYKLRMCFWLEYERSTVEIAVNRAQLDMSYILGHNIAKEAFYANYITNNYRLAFLLNPPFDFESSCKLALSVCHDAVLETIQRLGAKQELSHQELRFLQVTYDKFLVLSGHGGLEKGAPKRSATVDQGEEETEEKIPVEEGGDIASELEALSKLSEQVEI